MHERLDYLTADRPRQFLQPGDDTLGQVGELPEPGARAVLGQGGLAVIARPCPRQHPFPPVVIAQPCAQPDVVAPRLELADRGVPRRGQPRGLPAVIRGLRLERDARQTRVDEPGDVLVEDAGADTRPARAAASGTAVADEPLRVDGPGEHQPARRAPGEPGEQPIVMLPRVVADAADTIGLLPQLPGDDRRPRILDPQAPWPDEGPEVRLAADDSLHRLRGPAHVSEGTQDAVSREAARDGSPTGPASALMEDPLDHGGRVVVSFGQPREVSAVPERWLAGVSASGRCSELSGAEAFVGLVEVELRHQQDQAQQRAAHRCGRVDVLGDTDDARALLVQLGDRREPAEQRASEPVETSDHDPAGRAGRNAFPGGVHARPVHRAAGPVEVLVPRGDANTMRERPPLDSVALRLRRLEPVALATGDLRHADVAVEDLSRHRHSRIVHGATTSRHRCGLTDMARATSNCTCGGPCFYCNDDLPGAHDHDHFPIPWRHGGRETVPACRRCHKLKDYRDLADWPPAALEAAADGMQGVAGIVLRLLAASKEDPTFDPSIPADLAMRCIHECTTTEARIFLARSIAFAHDEAKRRRDRGAVV